MADPSNCPNWQDRAIKAQECPECSDVREEISEYWRWLESVRNWASKRIAGRTRSSGEEFVWLIA
jgi:hypothetical protein